MTKEKQEQDDDWDFLIVSDGSGSSWRPGPSDRGCGWASVLATKATKKKKIFVGAMNPGTVSLGELFAIAQPLLYVADLPPDERPRFPRVRVITDSQYVADAGNGKTRPKKHAALWRAVSAFAGSGLKVEFVWSPRMSSDDNKLADHLAGECRKAILAINAKSWLRDRGLSKSDKGE